MFPFAALPEDQRRDLRRRTATALARAYFNMGVMHARADRPARAAELLQSAATLDPAFPQIDASLGSTYFKAQQYDKAVEPLARASAANPSDASVRRMLAMSLIERRRRPSVPWKSCATIRGATRIPRCSTRSGWHSFEPTGRRRRS